MRENEEKKEGQERQVPGFRVWVVHFSPEVFPNPGNF